MSHRSVGRILVVCSADQARSPLCAALLRRQARRRLVGAAAVDVSSAGVAATPGQPPVDDVLWVAQRWSLELSDHRSRRLDAGLITDSDLIVTMTVEHRDAAARLAPDSARIITLGDLAQVGAHLGPPPPDADPRASIVATAAAARAMIASRVEPFGSDDVVDPYGQPRSAYLHVANQLARLTRDVSVALFGGRS